MERVECERKGLAKGRPLPLKVGVLDIEGYAYVASSEKSFSLLFSWS